MEVSGDLKKSYGGQYSSESEEWRMIGARYKAQHIIDLTQSLPVRNVLEVGAGEGSILAWLSRWNFCDDLNGVEISESGVQVILNKKIPHVKEVLLFDGYRIPYPDNHFDLVICSHVMEHVEHERLLLREIKRVSRHQVFEVPIDFSFYVDRKLKHFLSYGHINIYTPSLFRFLLRSEGFNIEKDACYLFEKDALKPQFKGRAASYYLVRLKQFLIRLFPYVLGIKPNAYAALCSKTKDELHIF